MRGFFSLSTPFPPAFLYLYTRLLPVLLESYEQDQILEDLIVEQSTRKMGRELGKQQTPLIGMQVDSKRKKEKGLSNRPTDQDHHIAVLVKATELICFWGVLQMPLCTAALPLPPCLPPIPPNLCFHIKTLALLLRPSYFFLWPLVLGSQTIN